MMITILIGIAILGLTTPKSVNAETTYHYTDENGVTYITDNRENLPESYKNELKGKTPIIVKSNSIYVSVEITYQGDTTKTYLILDTGCSGISISPALANRIGLSKENGRPGMTMVADGSKVETYSVKVDSIQVGPKIMKKPELQILPNKENVEFGLLGMSFLKQFPHIINTKAKVIQWM